MSEEIPAAPAPEAAPAETSTPAAPAPASAAPASAPEQPAQPATTAPAEGANDYFTKEQLAEMQKFISNNGGYDAAWKKMKAGISAPKAPQEVVDTQPNTQPNTQPQAPQSAPQSFREGSYSLEEIAAQQYFDRLANEPKYASIADEIRKGKVLSGLKDFNINPISDGRVNDADIRRYLDLYAASKPATPTSVEPTSSPVDYVQTATEGKVTTMDEANKIQLQSLQLQAAGQPPHPLEQAAKEFIKSYYSQKKK